MARNRNNPPPWFVLFLASLGFLLGWHLASAQDRTEIRNPPETVSSTQEKLDAEQAVKDKEREDRQRWLIQVATVLHFTYRDCDQLLSEWRQTMIPELPELIARIQVVLDMQQKAAGILKENGRAHPLDPDPIMPHPYDDRAARLARYKEIIVPPDRPGGEELLACAVGHIYP